MRGLRDVSDQGISRQELVAHMAALTVPTISTAEMVREAENLFVACNISKKKTITYQKLRRAIQLNKTLRAQLECNVAWREFYNELGANGDGQMSKEVLVQYYIRCRPQQKISPASPRSPLSPSRSSAAKQALLEETSIASAGPGRKQTQTLISEKEISVSKAPGQVTRTEHVVSTISDVLCPQRGSRTKMTTTSTTTTTRSRQSDGGGTGTSEEDKWVAREARAKERLEQQKNEELAQDQATSAAIEAIFIPPESGQASIGPDELLPP